MQEFKQRHLAANKLDGLKNIKNIIAVGSGKGGVGKSTIALNLALGFKELGAKVGILDADIYGPSLPLMLGKDSKPIINADKSIEPITVNDIQAMSIGFLIEGKRAAIWRGPMASGALLQMLNSTKWDNLDVLIIDLPPGTGDIQLTLAQKIPVVGAVVVTTPQNMALIDVSKAINMFYKVNIPVFGVVENMAEHICSNCGNREHIFAGNAGQQLAKEHGVPLLASIALDKDICLAIDSAELKVLPEFINIATLVKQQLKSIPLNRKITVDSLVVEHA